MRRPATIQSLGDLRAAASAFPSKLRNLLPSLLCNGLWFLRRYVVYRGEQAVSFVLRLRNQNLIASVCISGTGKNVTS